MPAIPKNVSTRSMLAPEPGWSVKIDVSSEHEHQHVPVRSSIFSSAVSDVISPDEATEYCYFSELKFPCTRFTAVPGYKASFALNVSSIFFGDTRYFSSIYFSNRFSCYADVSVAEIVNLRNATYVFGGTMVTLRIVNCLISPQFSVPGLPDTPDGYLLIYLYLFLSSPSISRAACQIFWCPQFPQCKSVCSDEDPECAYHPPAFFDSFYGLNFNIPG